MKREQTGARMEFIEGAHPAQIQTQNLSARPARTSKTEHLWFPLETERKAKHEAPWAHHVSPPAH
jgi:hypothetical protein